MSVPGGRAGAERARSYELVGFPSHKMGTPSPAHPGRRQPPGDLSVDLGLDPTCVTHTHIDRCTRERTIIRKENVGESLRYANAQSRKDSS